MATRSDLPGLAAAQGRQLLRAGQSNPAGSRIFVFIIKRNAAKKTLDVQRHEGGWKIANQSAVQVRVHRVGEAFFDFSPYTDPKFLVSRRESEHLTFAIVQAGHELALVSQARRDRRLEGHRLVDDEVALALVSDDSTPWV